MMLLKTEKFRRGREKKRKKRGWVARAIRGYFVTRGRLLHVWMERAWLEVDACVFFLGKRARGDDAFYAFGIICIPFPHLDFAQRRSNVKWGISAARARRARSHKQPPSCSGAPKCRQVICVLAASHQPGWLGDGQEPLDSRAWHQGGIVLISWGYQDISSFRTVFIFYRRLQHCNSWTETEFGDAFRGQRKMF